MQVSTPVRKQYVRYCCMQHPTDGGDEVEDEVVEIDHNDHTRINPPVDAYAFQFESRIHVTVIEDGVSHELMGDYRVDGPTYIVGGNIFTLNEVRGLYTAFRDRVLRQVIEQMEADGCERAIKTPQGVWLLFTDTCVLLTQKP